MIIQNDPYRGFSGIISIQFFQQSNKFAASMSVMNLSNDMAIMQIQRRQNRQSPKALVFIIPHDPGLLSWFWHNIRRNILDGLHARLLIHGYGNNRGNAGVPYLP